MVLRPSSCALDLAIQIGSPQFSHCLPGPSLIAILSVFLHLNLPRVRPPLTRSSNCCGIKILGATQSPGSKVTALRYVQLSQQQALKMILWSNKVNEAELR